jgi:hypothetical protein
MDAIYLLNVNVKNWLPAVRLFGLSGYLVMAGVRQD